MIIDHLNVFVLFNCKQLFKLRERLRNKILTEKHKEENENIFDEQSLLYVSNSLRESNFILSNQLFPNQHFGPTNINKLNYLKYETLFLN